MRNKHVPAYAPVDDGVQEFEYSGVLCELMNVICMPIDIEESDPPMSILVASLLMVAVMVNASRQDLRSQQVL